MDDKGMGLKKAEVSIKDAAKAVEDFADKVAAPQEPVVLVPEQDATPSIPPASSKKDSCRMTEVSPMVSGSKQLELLLARMAVKDECAFEKLYVATKRKIFSTVLLIVKRRHLAEEVVQEAYLRIWLHAALYKPSLASPMV